MTEPEPPDRLFDPTPRPPEPPERRTVPPPSHVVVATASPAELRGLWRGGVTHADWQALITRVEDQAVVIGALEASRTGARSDGPQTSADAAEAVRLRERTLSGFKAGTQKHVLLSTYGGHQAAQAGGLTDSEVARLAGLYHGGICWWKRCSELRQIGFIELTDSTRPDKDSRAEREVCRITDTGRRKLASLLGL